jgi:hypothetical protein
LLLPTGYDQQPVSRAVVSNELWQAPQTASSSLHQQQHVTKRDMRWQPAPQKFHRHSSYY